MDVSIKYFNDDCTYGDHNKDRHGRTISGFCSVTKENNLSDWGVITVKTS